jgi:protein ImuB
VTPFLAHIAFAEPIAVSDDIERGLDRLLEDLCRRLERAGRGARQLVLTLYRVDGEIVERRVGAARPARDAAHLARLFAGRLGGFDPGFGVESMTLAAPVSEPLAPSPGAALIPGGAARFRAEDLAPLIDRLGNRIGFDQVVRLSAHASHLPERAVRARPALAESMHFAWPLTPMRPLRLLAAPERIEAAAPAPPGDADDPPAWFRWRRVDHRIRAAEGPERIAPEWWRRAGKTRDYWRVEDGEGRRFWIYRYALQHRDRPPQWYLHGLFG